jgi:hypothetical protein
MEPLPPLPTPQQINEATDQQLEEFAKRGPTEYTKVKLEILKREQGKEEGTSTCLFSYFLQSKKLNNCEIELEDNNQREYTIIRDIDMGTLLDGLFDITETDNDYKFYREEIKEKGIWMTTYALLVLGTPNHINLLCSDTICGPVSISIRIDHNNKQYVGLVRTAQVELPISHVNKLSGEYKGLYSIRQSVSFMVQVWW